MQGFRESGKSVGFVELVEVLPVQPAELLLTQNYGVDFVSVSDKLKRRLRLDT